jgi:hypothetical protein
LHPWCFECKRGYFRAYNAAPERRAAKRAFDAGRRAAKLRRTPPWVTETDRARMGDLHADAALFSIAFRGAPFAVDHILPLQGKDVSGLHVVENLQVLRASANSAKRNRFDPVGPLRDENKRKPMSSVVHLPEPLPC